MLTVVLVEPEIPPNTGNIARLCSLTGSRLHLVGPMGFSLSDKHCKRAGLDYWDRLTMTTWKNWNEWIHAHHDRPVHLFTTKSSTPHFQTAFGKDDFLIFGRESRGLPESLLQQFPEHTVRIPMPQGRGRSLNLATSVAIGLYEALRQTGQAEEC